MKTKEVISITIVYKLIIVVRLNNKTKKLTAKMYNPSINKIIWLIVNYKFVVMLGNNDSFVYKFFNENANHTA